jgi:hypothetical protein
MLGWEFGARAIPVLMQAITSARKEISRRGSVLFGILSKSQLILILLKSEFAQVRQVNFHVVPTM